MGWSITYGASKRDTIQDLTKQWGATDGSSTTRCVAKSVRGNVLYYVLERTFRDGAPAIEGKPATVPPPEQEWRGYPATESQPAVPPGGTRRFLAVSLLGTDGQGNWGSKDMDESMGPCEVACPAAYLAMVPNPGGYATKWRESVREYHARRTGAVETRRRLATRGTIFTLRGIKGPRVFVSEGMVRRTLTASGFRIATRLLAGDRVTIHPTWEAANAFLQAERTPKATATPVERTA